MSLRERDVEGSTMNDDPDDRKASDRLIIKTLRTAIVCAWLMMACMVASAVINTCGHRCECPTAERVP